jgi:hypothetical protein
MITLSTEAITKPARRAISQFMQIKPTRASQARMTSDMSSQNAAASVLIPLAIQRIQCAICDTARLVDVMAVHPVPEEHLTQA